MRFVDRLLSSQTLRQSRGRSKKRRRYDCRLRAVICLFLYTHNFAVGGVATDDSVLTQCRGGNECVGAGDLPGYSQMGE